jgi:hypothetical protein
MAYGIDLCHEFGPLNRTSYSVQCHGSFLDSDTYQAHVICNGAEYHSGNYVTPIFGGWGEWATVNCPPGQSYSQAYYTTHD